MSREVVTQLEERGCSVVRVWAGHLVTSLGAPICEAMRINVVNTLTPSAAIGLPVLLKTCLTRDCSPEMAGFLVSVLVVTNKPDWLDCLDCSTAAPAWPAVLGGTGPRSTPAKIPAPVPLTTGQVS